MRGISRLFGTGLALLFLVGSVARADFISWSYLASGSSTVSSDTNNSTGVNFVYDPQTNVVGNSAVAITNLWTFSNTQPPSADTFTNAAYNVALNLTDAASGKSGVVDFMGALTGTVSAQSALLNNTFTSPTVQSIALGSNLYTVTLAAFAPPGPPNSGNAGALSASISVHANTVPEPPAAVLALLGFGGLGMAGWLWRRHVGPGLV